MDYMDWAFERDLDPMEIGTAYKLYEEYAGEMEDLRAEFQGLDEVIKELHQVAQSEVMPHYMRLLCRDARGLLLALEREVLLCRRVKE